MNSLLKIFNSLISLMLILGVSSTQVLGATSATTGSISGAWTLRSRTCAPDGNFYERIINKFTGPQRQSFASEILIISPDGAINIFNVKGMLLSQGEYSLQRDNSMRIASIGRPFPDRLEVKHVNANQLITYHKDELKCQGGNVLSSYLRVRQFSQ